MKVIQINTVYGKGSTGKIAEQIQHESFVNGIENIVAYRYAEGEKNEKTYCISTWLDCHVHNRLARYTHRIGYYSRIRTLLFLKFLNKEKPDIIHIHNIHGAFVNIRMLFHYIKKHKIKTIWTFHDCWPITGYCPYFDINQCDNWKNGCKDCCCENSILNRNSSYNNLKLKKEITDRIGLTIVTPSQWLADIVKQTFYARYRITTIHNGVDISVFYPRESEFRKKHGISDDTFMLLGVASVWEERKGLNDFIELSNRLSEKYKIVLVGTNEQIDHLLPDKIISIHRTENQIELAEIYTAANLFVNPTKDEVLGMVNIEANACGTPVVTYRSGGSPECIGEESGIVVECGDIDALEKAITYVRNAKPFSRSKCVEYASRFEMSKKFDQYISLYESIGYD